MRRRVIQSCFLLTACGSSPRTHFYVLDPVPGSQQVAARSHAPVQVTDVTIPQTLDRLSLVRRSGPGQLDVSDIDRWAAPLDALIRRALTEDLATRLPAGAVVPPGEPAPSDTRRLDVRVQQFIGDMQGVVMLDTVWVLQDARRRIVAHGHEELQAHAANGTPSAIVQTMSQLLGEFADRLAPKL